MIKIGELSNITNVSVQTIRFYESKGLINPIEVDRWTGYRYYDETSITRLSEINYLKDLGFSLDEIANMDEITIKNKLAETKANITKFKNNLSILSSLKIKGDKVVMKNFVNDEQAIGKWKRVGVVKEKQNFKNGDFADDDQSIFNYPELYFLPNGEPYYVFSWTKGFLYLLDRKLPYEIKDNVMYIGVVDNKYGDTDNYAVFERVDNKHYTKEEIRVKDNTDIPFVDDSDVIGMWNVVDFVKDKSTFNPLSKAVFKDMIFDKYIFENNGKLISLFNTNEMIVLRWSKGIVINDKKSTVSEYEIKEIDGTKYMFVEWKSGDYTFGGNVKGYYVFKKA